MTRPASAGNQAGDHVEHGGLAGAVGAQQARPPRRGPSRAITPLTTIGRGSSSCTSGDREPAFAAVARRLRRRAGIAGALTRWRAPAVGRRLGRFFARNGKQPHPASSLRSRGLALVLGSPARGRLCAAHWEEPSSDVLGLLLGLLRDRTAGTACRADRCGLRRRWPGPGERCGRSRRDGAELTRGRLRRRLRSSSKRYMPVVRSILSRGPSATSLPRETTTPSPSSTVLALDVEVRPVAGGGLAVLGGDQHLLLGLDARRAAPDSCCRRLAPLGRPRPAWPV